MFGVPQSSSPFSSTTTFGASSSPAFANSVPSFGATSTSAFGSSRLHLVDLLFLARSLLLEALDLLLRQVHLEVQISNHSLHLGVACLVLPHHLVPQVNLHLLLLVVLDLVVHQATPAFGSCSTPAFGASSTSSFGASSTPTFGATASSAFGAGTAFGVSSNPVFGSGGGFGASTTPVFGTSSTSGFGASSSAFGDSSTSVFGGASSTPAFGASNTPAFGTSSTPSFSFSSIPSFGQSTSTFGNTPFGTTTSPFSAQSSPFGGQAATFGCTGFGQSGFAGNRGGSRVVAYSATAEIDSSGGQPGKLESISAMPAYKDKSHEELRWEDYQLGDKGGPLPPDQSSGGQAMTATFGCTGFGQSGFAGNRGGSRVVAYSATAEIDSSGGQPGKLESISAMPAYKDKSHEELRWEDYQLGDKGGPLPPGQSSGGVNFGVSSAPTNPFASSSTFGQSSASPFSSSISSNPFSAKPFGASSTPAFSPSPFTASPSNPFQSTSAFGSTSSSAFTANTAPSLFGSASTSAFGSTPSLFTSTVGQTSSSPFANFTNTQPSLSFQSTAPSFGQTGSAFGQVSSSFAPSTIPSFTQSSMFSTPSSGFAFSSTQSLMSSTNQGLFGQTSLSQSAPFQLSQPSQPTGVIGFGNFGQSQAAGTSGCASSSSLFGPSTFGQLSTTQSNVAVQPAPVTNPFGTLPAMPQMSIGRAGTTPSVQYGISNLAVVDKPAPIRISSLLTSRHLSQRRIRLPARKYNPKHDGPKVPFFCDEEETTGTPKADALFIPRENPRVLVIHPTDQWPLRPSSEKASPVEDASTPAYENGKASKAVDVPSSSGSGAGENMAEGDLGKERVHFKQSQKSNGVHDDNSFQKEDTYMTLSGNRAGEAAIAYEHGADIEALMPKLRRSDYFTEPQIQELAAKERAEPGFCRHVKDFVVGRHGYGSIKFLGETDVRRIDLESLVQFNNREVIVYTDDSKKPAIGQGLNKPAEVTLLNIKCFNKKTGRQCTEGSKIEKYEVLQRTAEDEGAEFVSYDSVKGVWKFRVNHFSKYRLGDEDDDDSVVHCTIDS